MLLTYCKGKAPKVRLAVGQPGATTGGCPYGMVAGARPWADKGSGPGPWPARHGGRHSLHVRVKRSGVVVEGHHRTQFETGEWEQGICLFEIVPNAQVERLPPKVAG